MWTDFADYLINGDDDEEIIAYPDIKRQQLLAAALSLSNDLQQAHRQTAALWFEDSVLFACSLLACAHAGVDVLLPQNLTEDNLAWIKTADVILSDSQLDNRFSEDQTWLINQLSALPNAQVPSALKNIKLLLKTSGSNGQAKVIEKDLYSMQIEAAAMRPIFASIESKHKIHVLGSVSPQHLYGLSFRIIWSLSAGWLILPQQLIYPESLFEYTEKCPQVFWISSPALLHRVKDNPSWQQLKNKVIAVISAGGPLHPETADYLRQQLGLKLIEIYGSTETGIIASKENKLWQWAEGVVHGIEENTEAIWVESPWSEGRQQTADMIEEHQDGFELLGRCDRIIKLEDKRISLTAIEQELNKHIWVDDVFISKHPQYTHLLAWIALNQAGIDAWRDFGRQYVISQIKEQIKTHIEKIALPRYWRFSHHLPRNAQSKISQQDFEQVVISPIETPDWQLLEQQDHTQTFMTTIPLDLTYFKGHFERFHLVPGVVQLKWVFALAQSHNLISSAAFSQIENLKFQQFMRPNDMVYLQLRLDKEAHKLFFKYYVEDKTVASGRIVLMS